MKKIVRTLFVIILGGLLISCKGEKEEVETPDLDSIEILPEVVFTVVDDEPLRYYIESRGVVEPIQKLVISPKISGFIEKHNIASGKEINKGDLILQFDKEELENSLQEAENNYLQAKNEYETTIRSQQAYSGNFDDKLIRINTGLANAELIYERAKLNLKYTTMKAPFSGTVSTDEVLSVGAFIGAGKDLGSLLNTKKVRVRFDVLEKEVIQLNKGMDVEIKGPSNDEYIGKIVAISPEIDEESKTGQAIVEVNNPDGTFKTGMTVEGRIFVRSATSKVRMPRESLLARDGRTLVFKLNKNEVEWIYVTPEEMNTEWVLINHEEINPGDTLAVDKHFSISHQQKVVPLIAN